MIDETLTVARHNIMRRFQIREGDAVAKLAELDAVSVQTCVTSPPYFGLRDYGVSGQIGLEKTPEAYVAALVGVFRGVHRVLRNDGTVWLNLGDSYNGGGPNHSKTVPLNAKQASNAGSQGATDRRIVGLKPKDLIGIPWMVAFALRADGWYLRSDIIWNKPNPMPESVEDRPTKSHEYIFLLSKSAQYFYDGDAILEPNSESSGGWQSRAKAGLLTSHEQGFGGNGQTSQFGRDGLIATGRGGVSAQNPNGRNKRTVWMVATHSFSEAHFATFPPKLIEPCILAGSREGDTVLDPFAGAGTTGLVALRHNRHFIGIELNPTYCEMARRRVLNDAPLFNEQVA